MDSESAHTVSFPVMVKDHRGMHLRLASEISCVCKNYPSVSVAVARCDKPEIKRNGRAPFDLILLEAGYGTALVVTCSGDDTGQVQSRICEIFSKERK